MKSGLRKVYEKLPIEQAFSFILFSTTTVKWVGSLETNSCDKRQHVDMNKGPCYGGDDSEDSFLTIP